MGLETDTRKTKFGDGTTSWTSLAYATSAGLISSDTAPDSPSVGAQWFNSSTGKTYVYYDGYWVELDSNGTSAQSNGNAIINGAFDIWQRGTSFSNAAVGAYVSDRWRVDYGGTPTSMTTSRQAFTLGSAPVAGYEGEFFFRNLITTPGTLSNFDIRQRIEDVRTFAGQTVTLSFFAKADTARTSIVYILQEFGSGGSAGVFAAIPTLSLTSSWARYSFTFNVPSIAGKTIGAGNNLTVAIRQDIAAGSTIDIWGVQVEAGSVATPFKRNANSIQGELAACQRYFLSIGNSDASGSSFNTTRAYFSVTLPVQMRVGPTATFPTSGAVDGFFASGNKSSATAPQIWSSNPKLVNFYSDGYSGLTANDWLKWNGNAIQLGAEL